MKKYLIALTIVLAFSFNSYAASPAQPEVKENPDDIATYVETTVKIINVDKKADITNSKTVKKNHIIDHGKEGFSQEQIMKLVEKARKNMPENPETLGITKEATDFINAAKGGVSSLAGSVASTVGGLISGTVSGAIAAIF
jgi:ABC-type microcin C transport system permease subunit YejE